MFEKPALLVYFGVGPEPPHFSATETLDGRFTEWIGASEARQALLQQLLELTGAAGA